MKSIYKYRLKLKKNRAIVDLREYKAEIKFAIQSAFNDTSIRVVVRKEYYKFYCDEEKVTRGILVKIGRGITRLCPQLCSFGYLYVPKDRNKRPILQLFRRAKLGGTN